MAVENPQNVCVIEGCDKRHYAKGYCMNHYRLHHCRGVCSVEGCERWLVARGMCNAHYLRWRWGTDLSRPIKKMHSTKKQYETCTIEGCGKKHKAKGLCQNHYWHQYHGGRPRRVKRAHRACKITGCEQDHYAMGYCRKHYQSLHFRKPCRIMGCERGAITRGLCSAHYQRFRSGGDMSAPIREVSPAPKYEHTGCKTEGCLRKHRAKGYCGVCYDRYVRVRPKKLKPSALHPWRTARTSA